MSAGQDIDSASGAPESNLTAGSSSNDGGNTSGSTHGGSSSEAADPDAASGSDAAVTVDAAPAPTSFLDSFERADSPNIGNDWTEKTDLFALTGGGVVQSGTGDYRDNIVLRPSSEDALDVELSMDVVHSAPNGDPCLFARIQRGTNGSGKITSYTFYYYDDAVFIDRDEGTIANSLAKVAIAPKLAPGTTVHMWFRVMGTSPVVLEGTLTTPEGDSIAVISTQDSSAQAIGTAGGVGFGSGDAIGARYDNFGRAP